MRVALRVEVNSLRGLCEGVPNLMRLFHEYQVRASFFFPLGVDDAGRSPLRAWRQSQVSGRKSLLFGTLAPAPSLAAAGGDLIRQARDNGHEVGVFGLSPRRWSRLGYADEQWVTDQCESLWQAAAELRGEGDIPLATPAWQLSPALLRDLANRACAYTSMTRGKMPYLPMLQGERSERAEIPTTLPTADEMLRQPEVSTANLHEYLYAESGQLVPAGHVYSLSAEREGLELYPVMEKLLVMWKGQDGSVRALGDMLNEIQQDTLPVHQVGWQQAPGGGVAHATQSVQVPR